MGYQTSWLTHEHDIALLKPKTPTRHGVERRAKPELEAGSPFC